MPALSQQPVLFAKDETLLDPSSTSFPWLKCVLQLGLQLVKDSIHLAATKWTAKHFKVRPGRLDCRPTEFPSCRPRLLES